MPGPSYDELASLVAGLIARVEALELENSALKRKLGTDSTNSSTPPSQDSLAAKGKRQTQRVRSKDRKRGGQAGRKGSGLTPAAAPDRDRTETAPVPQDCSGCGTDLSDGTDAGMSWTQVWDTPAIRLEKVHYLLPKRKCSCCRKITTSMVPFGQAGAVTYGPNVNAAAILLGSAGNVCRWNAPRRVMAVLLGSPVSSRVRRARP